jgi:hypothetical protein
VCRPSHTGSPSIDHLARLQAQYDRDAAVYRPLLRVCIGCALAGNHRPRQGLRVGPDATGYFLLAYETIYLSSAPYHSGNFVFLGVALLTGVPSLYIGLYGLFGGLSANPGS